MGRGNGVIIRGSSIQLFFVLDGVRHKHKLVVNGEPLRPTQANLKYASRLAVEIRQKIAAGVFSLAEYFPASATATIGRGLTVSEQLDSWLQAQRVASSTRAGYVSAKRFWSETIGGRPLRALKHSDILSALATRPALTGKTVNNYVSVLREAMALAVLDHAIESNPVEHVARAKHQRPAADPLTLDEAEKVLAYMRKHYDGQVVRYTEFKLFTGLRTSESFGLRWRSVDWNKQEAMIHEAIVRGEELDRTKTSTARVVRLNSRAMAVLREQKASTFLLQDGHVFHDPRYSTPWRDERAFRRSFWAPALKATGVRYRPPYNTRHTYATMMLMAGMTPEFCARQMGHSVEMFLKTYTNPDDSRSDIEMGKLESFLSPGSSHAVPTTGARR